jgi:hypothetical protein
MHAVHRQRAQQGGLRVIGGSMSLGFEMMVLEGVREGERMLVSSWIHKFFDHRVAFSKKNQKKGHTSIEFDIVLQDTRDLEQSPEVLT